MTRYDVIWVWSECYCEYIQDAVYIDLGGSHGDREKDGATSELLSSLISARHPLDQKMRHAELVLMEGGAPLLGEGCEGVRRRRVVPDEEGGSMSGGEGDIDSQSDVSDGEMEDMSDQEDLGEFTTNGVW